MTPALDRSVNVPPAGFLARYWPPPDRVPSGAMLAGAGAAGLTAAVALVVGSAGLGWLLTGLVVAATAVRRRPTPAQVGGGLAALAPLATGALRAGWPFA